MPLLLPFFQDNMRVDNLIFLGSSPDREILLELDVGCAEISYLQAPMDMMHPFINLWAA